MSFLKVPKMRPPGNGFVGSFGPSNQKVRPSAREAFTIEHHPPKADWIREAETQVAKTSESRGHIVRIT